MADVTPLHKKGKKDLKEKKTTDQLLLFQSAVDSGQIFGALLADLSKAFEQLVDSFCRFLGESPGGLR